jgi:hypothetical protein
VQVFDVKTVAASGNRVIGVVHVEWVHRTSGKRFVDPYEVHIFDFDDSGKVKAFIHAMDSLELKKATE